MSGCSVLDNSRLRHRHQMYTVRRVKRTFRYSIEPTRHMELKHLDSDGRVLLRTHLLGQAEWETEATTQAFQSERDGPHAGLYFDVLAPVAALIGHYECRGQLLLRESLPDGTERVHVPAELAAAALQPHITRAERTDLLAQMPCLLLHSLPEHAAQVALVHPRHASLLTPEAAALLPSHYADAAPLL